MRRLVGSVVAFALAAAGCANLGIGEQRIETTTISADVEQAPNLFEGSRVTVRGVEVGKIIAIEPREDFVRIIMEVDEGVPVPADAQASIVPITVIADRYVQLFPAYTGGPVMEDGGHIPLAKTTIPAELDEVLTELQDLLSTFEPDEGEKRGPLAKLVNNLHAALKGHDDDLAGALERSSTVLENLANSDLEIASLIRNLDRLFVAVASRSSEIGLINQRFALVARSLRRDQANLEGTIEGVAFLSEQFEALIRESGGRLGLSFRRLSTVLREVLSHQDSLTLAMRWTNVIAQTLGGVDVAGRGLYAYTGLQAPPGTPGAEYNYRIDQRDTVACERIEKLIQTLEPFGTPSADQAMKTVFEYLPAEYHDDLHSLIKELVLACYFDAASSSSTSETKPSPAERALLREAARVLGKRRLRRFLARWFFEGTP